MFITLPNTLMTSGNFLFGVAESYNLEKKNNENRFPFDFLSTFKWKCTSLVSLKIFRSFMLLP